MADIKKVSSVAVGSSSSNWGAGGSKAKPNLQMPLKVDRNSGTKTGAAKTNSHTLTKY